MMNSTIFLVYYAIYEISKIFYDGSQLFNDFFSRPVIQHLWGVQDLWYTRHSRVFLRPIQCPRIFRQLRHLWDFFHDPKNLWAVHDYEKKSHRSLGSWKILWDLSDAGKILWTVRVMQDMCGIFLSAWSPCISCELLSLIGLESRHSAHQDLP